MRPTAKDLLKHRFVKSAKRSNTLVELIDRLALYKKQGGQRDDMGDGSSGDDAEFVNSSFSSSSN